MGPLWCGQGTVPHTTLSDLLPTDVLLSPIHVGAPVEAAWGGDIQLNMSNVLTNNNAHHNIIDTGIHAVYILYIC